MEPLFSIPGTLHIVSFYVGNTELQNTSNVNQFNLSYSKLNKYV